MVITLGIIGTVVGAALATGASRYPSRMVRLEQWGGGLFVCGIVLLASTFPMV